MEGILKKVKDIINSAEYVAVLTGAGISAASGVPTFRGKDGLWKQYRAEDLATPQSFRRNPQLVWQWYDWRRSLIAKCKPNKGHYALVELENRKKHFALITQNVDGLHQLAGSKSILELHGNIWRTRCTQCGDIREDRRVPIPILPHCEKCGGLLRPDIVWFGESLNHNILNSSFEALKQCNVFITVGTSAIVQPAASFLSIAKQNGAITIEINLDKTPNSDLADYSLIGKADEILPQII